MLTFTKLFGFLYNFQGELKTREEKQKKKKITFMHSKLNPRIKNRAAAKERKVTKK